MLTNKGYKLGSVWGVSLISVQPGQGDEYLKSLKTHYSTVIEHAIREKVILSYKILSGSRASPQDWDVMILIEAPNWAAYDGARDKLDAIAAKLAGSAEAEEKAMAERAKMRTIFGNKDMQEVIFTK